LGSLVEAVGELDVLLEGAAGVSRTELFARLRRLVAAEPTVIVLEDLHWADEATIDLLRFLGRRLDGLTLLLLATYRSEEVSPRRRLAVAMGELASEAGVHRLAVQPLSPSGVAGLVASAGSPIDPRVLHERSGGNPFFVTEVLAGGGADLPPTVRDAVLARVSRLPRRAQDVLAAAAVLGQPADVGLLDAVSGAGLRAVDACVDSGMLVPGPTGGWAFRHELARLAVEQSVAPSRLAELHRAALGALTGREVDDDRRLAHHAVGAGDAAAVHRHAVRAAQRAARLGAHREAAEHYRAALSFHEVGRSLRAELLVALSYECYLTDDVIESLAARLQALELAELACDAVALGRHQRWVSRLSWFLGRNADSERYADRAIATLVPAGDGHELAMAYSNRAQLQMLAGDVEGTRRWAEQALAVARRIDDGEAEIHALNNMGTVLLQVGRDLEGRSLLQRSLDLALTADAHEHVARAYTNLGSSAVLARRLADAERYLRAGIGYCADRDLDSWRLYMSAHRARLLVEQGSYEAAEAEATAVLNHAGTAPISVIVAASAAAQVAARRGATPAALLTRAWELARSTGEAQRLVPVATARAEAAWLSADAADAADAAGPTADAAGPTAGAAGPSEDVLDALDIAWAAATARPTPWEIGELAYWRGVFGLPTDSGCPVAAPFAAMLERRWQVAAADWQRLGCPLWQAIALAHDAPLESGRRALAIIDGLGAVSVRAAVLRTRHASGLAVPRGPRGGQGARSAGGGRPVLTSREFDVLQHLADGLSNAEIADRLFLSERTVGHHVSAVLRKLGEPTRARAVAAAARSGLIMPPLAADPNPK
jgi:DNA-binding CsgD family transcriptional regulator/tetratricopeptide (TPR) repeat protein